jgi:hypothetical protein
MRSATASFTPLERAVLDAILWIHPSDRHALQVQFAKASVAKRVNTGAGFYTDFNVMRDANAALCGERMRRGPTATVQPLRNGMGFILWLHQGFATCLEGYSYDESTAEMNFEDLEFEIVPTAIQE